jgi:hypothetical protein
MLEWVGLDRAAVWWMAIISASMVLVAVIAVPLLILRIPPDYFIGPHPSREDESHRLVPTRWTWRVARNLLGVACLFLGALMLVLPGQGTLTILVGLALLDFPGKFRLQRWIVARPGMLDSINWVRKRARREPLVLKR